MFHESFFYTIVYGVCHTILINLIRKKIFCHEVNTQQSFSVFTIIM